MVTYVAGVAKFQPDQDIVLFLGPASRGAFSIPGLETGLFSVVEGPDGQEILQGVGYPEGEKPWTLSDARTMLAKLKSGEILPGAETTTPAPLATKTGVPAGMGVEAQATTDSSQAWFLWAGGGLALLLCTWLLFRKRLR